MRKIFTLLSLAVAMSTSFAGAAPTLSFSGSGTQADPYLIKTKADLVELSKASSTDDPSQMSNVSGFQGVYFKLANDINLEYTTDFKGICASSSTIVIKQITFQGVFDGAGHTISGMSLNGVVWSQAPSGGNPGTPNPNASRTGTGFIGQLGVGGQVKNLSIAADCRISGYNETGAVVGSAATTSKIENCRNYADVTGYGQRTGGIVGYVTRGEVVSCFNAGNITAGDFYTGGIGGHIAGKITYCANTGDVAIKGLTTAKPEGDPRLMYCGGIAGRANDDVLSECLNTGNVSAYDHAGGITSGFNCIQNSVNYGMVSGTGKNIGAIATLFEGTAFQVNKTNDTYYDAQILTCGAVSGANFAGITACETSAMTTVTPLHNLDRNIWEFVNGRYPVLKQFASEPTMAQASQMVLTLGAGETVANISTNGTLSAAEGLKWALNDGAKFTISGNKLNIPSAKMTEPDMLTATFGTLTKRIPVLYTGEGQATGPFEGQGTKASPWLLKTKEDLIKLSQLTCAETAQEANSKERFEGKYFALANDIDLEYSEDFKGISVANNFQLINLICFCGELDGRGHSIKNMKIGRIAWTVKPSDAADGIGTFNSEECRNIGSYSSFIGRIGNGGVVKNLVIDKSCRIEGYSVIGGIAAEMTGNARIENCRNYADVLGYSSVVGGIVGRNMAGTTIKGCYNAGNVTSGILQVGGISGNNIGTIEECVNAGDVTSKHLTTNIPENQGYNANVGGIAGFATEGNNVIRNCVNLGTVSGEEEVGGLLGTFGLAEFCLNYGIVNSQNIALSGNIFGNKANMAGKFPITLYYDSQINKVRAVSNEDFTYNPGDGSEKEPVTIAMPTSELVSGKALTDLDETLWQFDGGMYPVLKQYADEVKVKAGRTTIAEMTQNNNAAMVTEAITLRPAEGLVWTCDDYFNIINGIAYSIRTGQGTITATNAAAGYTKKFNCAILKVAGVEDLINEKEVASTRYYTLDGCLVAKPIESDGRIYIVVINYTDGTSRTVKMLNK